MCCDVLFCSVCLFVSPLVVSLWFFFISFFILLDDLFFHSFFFFPYTVSLYLFAYHLYTQDLRDDGQQLNTAAHQI